jgi:DtxR family transcriptional regulator, Mn-dependent transcriptional regulator
MANRSEDELLTVGTDRSPARAREDYVKAIYQLGIQGPVRAAALARYLDVSRVSVCKAKRLLEAQRLLEPQRVPSAPLRLSPSGLRLAVAMVRRHRVLETFLHCALRMPLDRIHREAERIEHVISDDVALRIARLLGRPHSDPHGHPIPYANVAPRRKPLPTLVTLRAGESARVISLDDRDDRAVAALYEAGILPGVSLRIERTDAKRVFVRRGRRVVTVRRTHAAMVRIGA